MAEMYRLFHLDPDRFASVPIRSMGLRERTEKLLLNYLDPPLASPGESKGTLDEVLNLRWEDVRRIRNFGRSDLEELVCRIRTLSETEKK